MTVPTGRVSVGKTDRRKALPTTVQVEAYELVEGAFITEDGMILTTEGDVPFISEATP